MRALWDEPIPSFSGEKRAGVLPSEQQLLEAIAALWRVGDASPGRIVPA
jgi:hypothetical protein